MLILSVWVLAINPLSLHAQENPKEGPQPSPLEKPLPNPSPNLSKPVKEVQESSTSKTAKHAPDQQPSKPITPQVELPIPKKIEDTNKGDRKDNEDLLSPDLITKYTFWLVIVALLQAIILSTQTWFNRSLRNNQRIIDRAYVKMSHFPPGLEQIDTDNAQHDIRIKIKNFGQTPATITKIVIKYDTVPHDSPFPDIPDYTHERGTFKTNVFLVREDEFTFFHTFTILDDELQPIKRREKDLYIFGYTDYIDQFRTRHRAGYARKYDPRVDQPPRFGTPEAFENRNNLNYITQPGYNYDRPRQHGEGNDWETHI